MKTIYCGIIDHCQIEPTLDFELFVKPEPAIEYIKKRWKDIKEIHIDLRDTEENLRSILVFLQCASMLYKKHPKVFVRAEDEQEQLLFSGIKKLCWMTK